MITSNSSVDFISVMRASGVDPATMFVTEEFREWITEYLSENEVTVRFTKKDGSERTMRCTRNLTAIPTEHQPKTTLQPSTSDAIRAFDLDIQEWRSFNLSTLNHIEWN
jgi:hypothetical protein